MKQQFKEELGRFYKQLGALGDQAREIITAFVEEQGGCYTFDIENDDHVWVDEEVYATELEAGDYGVLVFNSGCFSEYLHDMDDYRVLDLAEYICNL